MHVHRKRQLWTDNFLLMAAITPLMSVIRENICASGCCESCLERYIKETFTMDDSSSYGTPLSSPEPSLTTCSSYGSCISGFDDFPDDMDLEIMQEGMKGVDALQDDSDSQINRVAEAGESHLDTGEHHAGPEAGREEEHGDIDTTGDDPDLQLRGHVKEQNRVTEETTSSSSLELLSQEGHSDNNVRPPDNNLDSAPTVESGSDGIRLRVLSNLEKEPLLWAPPEPADLEDDTDSISNDDNADNDVNDDNPKWVKSGFLSGINERQKAMLGTMNGEFRILVGRFLASAGFSLSAGKGDNNWLDIVTSLSWNAGLLVKPDACEGKEMDPWPYVKVKCVASGTPQQSKVIDGLVFTKSTAHKHMPTRIKNSKLLLLQGAIGHSTVGLSSMSSMELEKDNLEKSIRKILDTCHPNVVLVENTVSRDIQELFLKHGVALVFDMKLRRLEKIARCTGSPIIALADVLMESKLKQCRYFCVEKIVEEHKGIGDGGKRPCKTLMFFKGCPKPLGCTILLRGANSEELMKIKHVMHYTVFTAYQLILETSFFADQRVFITDKKDNFPITCKEMIGHVGEVMGKVDQEKPNVTITVDEKAGHVSDGSRGTEALGDRYVDNCENVNVQNMGEVDENIDREGILILLSSQCTTKQKVCEQGHLSRIKYYGFFDMALRRYLKDILLNEKHSCLSCGEPPEAHVYSYTHHNGNITVLVRSLHPEFNLSTEGEGKIWTWVRCLRCAHEISHDQPTQRVILSSLSGSLSFGQFLRLFFSSNPTAIKLRKCGHSLHGDCLRFFGVGSSVAMFRYSSIEIFGASIPPPVLEFHSPDRKEWLKDEIRRVLDRGITLFNEVGNFLQDLKLRHAHLAPEECSSSDSTKELSQIEEILLHEKTDLEVTLLKAVDGSGKPAVHEVLELNWLYQEFLLELYVWDQRLHHLLQLKGTLPDDVHKRSEDLNVEELPSCSGTHHVQNKQIELEINTDEATGSTNPEDNSIQIIKVPILESSTDAKVKCDDHAVSISNETASSDLSSSNPEFKERWIWGPFCDLLAAYRKELQGGSLERFHLINTYAPSQLSSFYPQSDQKMDSLHFTVGPGSNVLSFSEDEISSIVASALAVSENQRLQNIEAENEIAEAGDDLSRSTFDCVVASPSSSSLLSDDTTFSFDGRLLLASRDLHPEISVDDPQRALTGKYTVICVHAKQFYDLRKKCCPSELAYISSLSRCRNWRALGGKTKSLFLKTMDNRFIVKQIQKIEFESFLKFAPAYFKHLSLSLQSGSQTCLAKILGIYQIRQIKNGKETRVDLMVMENLLFSHTISRIYDLKGVGFPRYVPNTDDHEKVYWDQNFIEDMLASPIYVEGKTKHLLQRAIWNDTSFLTSINVMDYSLLVGVDKQRRELVFGMIDYLRQYTWDKQLETMVKASLVTPKNTLPTVVSPKEYRKRFRKFMSDHLLTVPDVWISELCAGHCTFCCRKDHQTQEEPIGACD